MMENRSFDHFLGWLPGANGKQAGLTYVDSYGAARSTYHLQDFQGCAHPDPDHSFEGGRVEYNNGACDGWLRAGENDVFAIGYYQSQDLALYGKAAANDNDWGYQWLPKTDGNHSWLYVFDDMYRGSSQRADQPLLLRRLEILDSTSVSNLASLLAG